MIKFGQEAKKQFLLRSLNKGNVIMVDIKEHKEKIAAVVVTYNRKKLLQECLDSLLKQTNLLDSIIIMNNASTDGTEEMLRKKYLKNPIFDYVNLGENTGGAGGFHYGIKRAYEKGFDWIWCMDDDSISIPNTLKELIKAKIFIAREADKIGFLSSNIRWTDGSQAVMNVPVFSTPWGKNNNFLKNGYLEITQSSFVSVLFNGKAIAKVGYPLKEFFIWLDDVEYTRRIYNAGFRNYLVMPSIVVHKTKDNCGTSVKKINSDNKFKYWFLFRNRLFLVKKSRLKEAVIIFINLCFSGLKLFFSRKIFYFFTVFLPAIIYGIFFNPKIKFPNPTPKE